jgi:pterin-4a-carbinolamine dehydratase
MEAQSGKLDRLEAAMKVVQGWPQDHPLYNEATRMMGEWSRDLLMIARQKINQGDLQGAIAITSQIPKTSPVYPDAQAAIRKWQQEWNRGEEITGKFENAVKTRNWQQAWRQVEALLELNYDYWRSSIQEKLTQQLALEKEAWQLLQQGRDLVKSNQPDQMQQAIAIAGKINPKSYIKQQAEAERNKWSRALLQIAAKLFNSKDFIGVMNVAKGIPADVSVYAEAQDWIHLGSAGEAGQKNNILAFLDALSAVRQISPTSPLYKQAQAQRSLWQSHLKGQQQLEFARAIASIDQPMTLQLAIDQAQQVGPKRPNRPVAQKLISSWRQEIQQIEERNTLAGARELAKPGTIESLKTAIAQASQIPPRQPLHKEAQAAIAQWKQQIETIQDQPILTLARAFAEKGDLTAAIQTAQKIRSGRALSSLAQADVKGWTTQIQIAEDQPLLDAATALASQKRLDAAIQTASQINAGRPLYKQAQAAIASWRSQLKPVLAPPPASSKKTSTNLQNKSPKTQGGSGKVRP